MEVLHKNPSRSGRTGSDRVRADGRARCRFCECAAAQRRHQYQFDLLARWFGSRPRRRLISLVPAPEPKLGAGTLSSLSTNAGLHCRAALRRRAKFLALSPEFMPLDHQSYRVIRPPHHPRPSHQFQTASILKDGRPTDRDIHPRSRSRRIRTPQTHSSAAHVQGLGSNRRIPLVRLQDGVTRFPPKWKSSRSTALVNHVLIVQYICQPNNRHDDSFQSGT